jgi:hypothetical protein
MGLKSGINGADAPEFRITLSSVEAQVLFYIKKELGFGSVKILDKKQITNSTHCFRVRDKKNLLSLISIFNGNLYLKKKNDQFKI